MRVGVIADVHANLVALEAVLADMPAVDRVVCLGDVVGYNPWPGECVDRVREVAAVTVEGNHDRTVGTPERYRANEMARAGLELARERLDDDQRAWLDGLPERATVGDGRVLAVHSHPAPAHRDRYVYPAQFAEAASHAGDVAALLLGHTHVQHAAAHDDVLVCNPGSVGQPRDGDPRAAYAVLDVNDAGAGETVDGETADDVAVDLRRVEYDVERVRDAVADAGLPARTGDRLLRGE
jgi:putative phosphoesterase